MVEPLVVSYGAGVDSTAMLIGLHARGIRPDAILFADTGGEHPGTYYYLSYFAEWLADVGFPAITTVRRAPTVARNGRGTYRTLEENCLINGTLPSLAFGRKACSLKWKVDPMNRWVAAWQPAIDAWERGERVRRAIGYDAGPKDAKRSWSLTGDARYSYEYPLREWGWDRDECEDQIEAAGLYVPRKSACFFCPATQPHELRELAEQRPDLCNRIRRLEENAAPQLTKIEGLWRKSTRSRPGSMTVFLNLLPRTA